MSRFPVENPRGDRHPPLDSSGVHVQCIGDVHFVSEDGFKFVERNTIARLDIDKMLGRERLSAIVQLGDHGNAAQADYDAYLAWRDAFDLTGGVQFGQVPGNHDIMASQASGGTDVVTPAQWAVKVGVPAKDYVIDVGHRVRLLMVSPAATPTGQAAVRRLTVDPATLAWCDDRMDEAPHRQCVIFFHAPLENTIGPVIPDAYTNSSFDEKWRAHYETSYTIAQMIAKHQNFVGWVAGHTHSRITEERLVVPVTYGSVTFAHIASSATCDWHPSQGLREDMVVSPLMSIYPDRIEVRYRDHGNGQWLDPVYTVNLA